MSSSRTSLLLALLASASATVQLVACGSDDAATVPDAGPALPGSSSGALPDAGPPNAGPTFTVSDTRAKLYLGQTAQLDGAALAPEVTGLTWTVVFAPSGSAVTTVSVQDSTTASPRFTPDRLGAYSLQGAGTKDGAAFTVVVFVEALVTPVFWREAHLEPDQQDGGTASEMKVGALHGGPAHAVACAPVTGNLGSVAAQYTLVGARVSASAGDTWEAPAGTASRVVFPDVTSTCRTSASRRGSPARRPTRPAPRTSPSQRRPWFREENWPSGSSSCRAHASRPKARASPTCIR